MDKTGIKVYAEPHLSKSEAEKAAKRLKIKIEFKTPDKPPAYPVLMLGEKGISLVSDGLSIRGDFSKMLPRLKTANLRGELLVRAAKVRSTDSVPRAIDATAGLGEDSLLLAASGYFVTMYEYNPVISLLLSDSLYRASLIPELAEITSRMKLIEADSLKELPHVINPPDIIYLDPMFPERQKSALVKKKFQLLHFLEPPCADEFALMKAAFDAHPKKIIIKRSVKAPFLAGIKPGYSISGDGIRFDCIVPN